MIQNTKIEDIREMFEVFDDPMDKYIQIIELGKKNSGLDEKEKNDTNRIFGCASLAWVKTKRDNVTYIIDTDSHYQTNRRCNESLFNNYLSNST